ncbi:MAG: hypothetical protein Q9163_005301, partial [Psora crenata]
AYLPLFFGRSTKETFLAVEVERGRKGWVGDDDDDDDDDGDASEAQTIQAGGNATR